jgi:glycosyltransferase involved in cell wall biosynthesis
LVARLSPEKDVATLIHAVRHALRLLGPEQAAFTLEIVGDGASRPQLESLSRNLGLGDTIRFLGERSDVASLLAHASMFVLPSLTEGISLTLLEAMARGLPVVATRVGGNPEVVVDGVTGFLVPVRDPAALAAAMVRIHQCPTLAAEMGLRGRRRVEQEFSVQKMIREYEQQYVDEGKP